MRPIRRPDEGGRGGLRSAGGPATTGAAMRRPPRALGLYKICKIKISGALNPADSGS